MGGFSAALPGAVSACAVCSAAPPRAERRKAPRREGHRQQTNDPEPLHRRWLAVDTIRVVCDMRRTQVQPHFISSARTLLIEFPKAKARIPATTHNRTCIRVRRRCIFLSSQFELCLNRPPWCRDERFSGKRFERFVVHNEVSSSKSLVTDKNSWPLKTLLPISTVQMMRHLASIMVSTLRKG